MVLKTLSNKSEMHPVLLIKNRFKNLQTTYRLLQFTYLSCIPLSVRYILSLRLIVARIPSYVPKDTMSQLEGLYDLDGKYLYSVKWYHDEWITKDSSGMYVCRCEYHQNIFYHIDKERSIVGRERGMCNSHVQFSGKILA